MIVQLRKNDKVFWLVNGVIIQTEPGAPARIHYNFNVIPDGCTRHCTTRLERKILYLVYGPQLRALGGIK